MEERARTRKPRFLRHMLRQVLWHSARDHEPGLISYWARNLPDLTGQPNIHPQPAG
jgi:hypothetical protein